jgi:hypothetical protein
MRHAACWHPACRPGRYCGLAPSYDVVCPPAVDNTTDEGFTSQQETTPIGDVVGSRLRRLNTMLDWDVPAETDAAAARGGGWAFS